MADVERRGRPRSPEPKTLVLRIRVTPSQRDTLQACAELNQLASISAFVREAIDEAASDCLEAPIFR
jgi:uncharacterized protein (DUF1778 family)